MAAADSEKPEVPMFDVQIDGEWYKFPKGTRMIEACKQAGREVPHYCYHPKLSSPGNCRMCLVEMGMPPRPRPGDDPPQPDEDGHLPISWMPRPAIACANTIAPNMGIRTQGTLTEECRQGVMEFLLINHPLDCPICDQAGECRLQEFSVEHGNGESRFREEKVQKPKAVDIGPRITLDDERCIMCSRCIRFTDEIADDPVLGFTERGSHTTLAVHPGKELANNYSLNTADICPVGALTSNDFRFQMRVWFLKETKSIDTHCGTGVNITIHSREGKIHRITPRENNDVNSCWMPDSHRLDFHYLDGPERLTQPMIAGEEEGHHMAPWDVALATAQEELSRFKGEQVAIVASGKMTNEELFLTKRLADAIGTKHLDFVPHKQEGDNYLISDDANPNSNGARVLLGTNNPGGKLKAIQSGLDDGTIKALLVFGEDLTANDAGFSSETLGKAEFLLCTHILANPTAQHATVVLPGAGWAEKRGSMINTTGRLQRLNRAIEPLGQAHDDWEILRDLIQGVNGSNGIYMIEDVFKQMAAEHSTFENLSLSKIGDQGVEVMKTSVTIPLLEREAERRAKGIIVG